MTETQARTQVLIVCIGNSCRSQMAEGLLRQLGGDRFEVYSAGSNPAGYVHPMAVQVMAELGIDISRHRSKHMNQFIDEPFDYVITVCDAAAEACPVFPGPTQRIHWPFDDPAKAESSGEQRLAVFRRVRDEIRDQLEAFVSQQKASSMTKTRKDVSWIQDLPTAGNGKLQALLDQIGQDVKLHQLWRVANVNAVTRTGITDHGPEHIGIVAGHALRLLRLLAQAGIQPNIVTDYGMTVDDAEMIVVLASCLHDIGISVHRDNHEQYSLIMAEPEGRRLLAGIYAEPELTIVVSETLHAVIAHRWDVRCLTLEAGAVKVADALDITKGRSRIPFEAGSTNIHSVSAAAIDDVHIGPGDDMPICIEIRMSNSAGIFQIDELLKRKLRNSTLAPYVQVLARIEGETEKRLVPFYSME